MKRIIAVLQVAEIVQILQLAALSLLCCWGIFLHVTDYFAVSAPQVFFKEASVKQVDVPTLTGAFGILPAHVPTLQVLRPGVVTVFSDDGSSVKYFGKTLENKCEKPSYILFSYYTII